MTIYCEKCGEPNSEEALFCRRCGQKIEEAANDSQVTAQATPGAASNKPKLPAVAIASVAAVALVAVIALVMVFILPGSKADSKVDGAASQVQQQVQVQPQEQTQEQQKKQKKQDWWFESKWLRIKEPLPGITEARISDEGDQVTLFSDECAILSYRIEGTKKHTEEAKVEAGVTAYVKRGGSEREVWASAYYTRPGEKKVAHWSDKSANRMLYAEIGLTHQMINDVLYFKTPQGEWLSATEIHKRPPFSDMGGTPESASPSDSSKAFYGIWSFASKSQAEAQAKANQIGRGAKVFLTTDWENLNSEPWYCVSIGVYSSESEAKAALPKIQNEVDSTAYVKYTGKHR